MPGCKRLAGVGLLLVLPLVGCSANRPPTLAPLAAPPAPTVALSPKVGASLARVFAQGPGGGGGVSPSSGRFNGGTITNGVTITRGTITTAVSPFAITETRNNAGVTFPGLTYTVTDTASGASSMLLQLIAGAGGATSEFTVDKGGNVTAPGTGSFGVVSIAAAGSLGFVGRSQVSSSADGIFTLLNAAGTNFTRLNGGGTSASFPSWSVNGAGWACKLADNSANCDIGGATVTGNTNVQNGSAIITAGAGTGITVNQTGWLGRQIYKVTVLSSAFIANAVTSDVTIGTLPAKVTLLGIYADMTQTFACASVCTTATLSLTLGSSAGGTDILLTFDADAATLQRGLVDGDLGTALARATAVQGGKMFSWSATTPLSLRLTSGTGNIGNGAATNLSQGSITFYVVTERMP